ncbi:MAG: hypothetical protein IKF48_03025 [Oscillospiraceae bacterium]|nr:hypothetical protein [Oscillospiraceae bacterium]
MCTENAVRDSLASDFPLYETGKSDKGIDQFLNWSMKAPPGLSDMIRIPAKPAASRLASQLLSASLKKRSAF